MEPKDKKEISTVEVTLAVADITIAGEKYTNAKGQKVQVTPEQAETMALHNFIETQE